MRLYTTLGDGIDALKREERAEPRPAAHEVLVRMRAVSLNYRDLLVVRGEGHWKPNAARIPISDGVGTVVEAGAGVTRVKPGDRVAPIFLPRWLDGELTAEKGDGALGGAAADGVMAELRVLDEQAVVRVPDHLGDAEAATLPVAALTAWHAVKRRCEVQPGDRVLVQGTGGVALAAIQFVHALGAEPIVISSSDAKLERARALGAGGTVNYRDQPDWEGEIIALTGGRGVDHVIETVGGENLNRSLRALKISGSIAFIGLLAGRAGQVETWQFVARNVRLHGIETGSREMFEEMNAFIARHRIAPVVDRTFAFDELPAALRHLEGGSHFGKIAIAF